MSVPAAERNAEPALAQNDTVTSMPVARWVMVGSVDDVPAREGRVAAVGRAEVAIFNLGVRFAAMDNRCPHEGGPLSDGIVAGAAVVCPLHAWKVNLDTGSVERPCESAVHVRTYPVRVEDGRIYVDVTAVFDTAREGHHA